MGTPYDLEVPRPGLFGNQSFAPTFTKSGMLSSLGYACTVGSQRPLRRSPRHSPPPRASPPRTEARKRRQRQRQRQRQT